MKILITGATGFIGRHLLQDLASDEVNIGVISRRKDVVFNGNVRVFRADLSDIDSMQEAFDGTDVLVNIAAELRNPERMRSTNVTGTDNIIELVRKYKVKKVVHLSSVGVVGMPYSASRVVVKEAQQCFPKNEYERTKLTSELKFAHAFGNDIAELVILRPTNVYGEENPRNALLHFFRVVKEGHRIFSSKDAMVNYLYVKDLTFAMRHFIFNKAGARIYNVGSSTKFSQFIHYCANAMKVEANYNVLPGFLLNSPSLAGYFGSVSLKTKLRSLTNRVEYSDELLNNEVAPYPYGYEKGIARTVNAYLEKGSL